MMQGPGGKGRCVDERTLKQNENAWVKVRTLRNAVVFRKL